MAQTERVQIFLLVWLKQKEVRYFCCMAQTKSSDLFVDVAQTERVQTCFWCGLNKEFRHISWCGSNRQNLDVFMV